MVGLPAHKSRSIDASFEAISPFGGQDIAEVVSSSPLLIKSGEIIVGIRAIFVVLKNGKKYCYFTLLRRGNFNIRRVVMDYFGNKGGGVVVITPISIIVRDF